MEANEALVAILKKSHAQVMAGQTVAMEEVERFINEIKLLYTVVEDTLFIEFVKNTRLDDATMLAKLSE